MSSPTDSSSSLEPSGGQDGGQVDLDVSRVSDRAMVRYLGWKVYLPLALAALFLAPALFLLLGPGHPAWTVVGGLLVLPLVVLGAFFFYLELGFFFPAFQRLPSQRRLARSQARRIFGDVRRLTIVWDDGHQVTFSLTDPDLDVQLRCPTALLQGGPPPPKSTAWLLVRFPGDRYVEVPLTSEAFEALRALIRSSGVSLSENDHAQFDSVPSQVLFVGRSGRRLRVGERGPWGWGGELPNPAARELVAAQQRSATVLFWLSLAIVLASQWLLQQVDKSETGSELAWGLVVPLALVAVLTFVLRRRANEFATTLPEALEMGGDAVTGRYWRRNEEDHSRTRVFRTLRFANVVDLRPWREPRIGAGLPAPAAVLGRFDSDPSHVDLSLRPAARDADGSSGGPHDQLYLSKENYGRVKAAWEEWKAGRAFSDGGLTSVAAGAWLASSDLHRTGPVRLPPPPGG